MLKTGRDHDLGIGAVESLLSKFRPGWGIVPILTMGMVSVIVLVVITFTAVEVGRERVAARNQLEQRGLQLAVTMNKVMFDSLHSRDIDQLGALGQAFASQSDISSVQVFSPDGLSLVDTVSEGRATEPLGSPWPLDALQTRQVVLQDTQGRLELVSPIISGEELIGGVLVRFDTSGVQAAVREIMFQRIAEGLFLIVIGVAISYLVARYLTKSLRALTSAAEDMGRGNLAAQLPGRLHLGLHAPPDFPLGQTIETAFQPHDHGVDLGLAPRVQGLALLQRLEGQGQGGDLHGGSDNSVGRLIARPRGTA